MCSTINQSPTNLSPINHNLRHAYPFTSHFLDLKGQRYHYLDEGPGGKSSETIVMLHGNPSWSYYYRNLILALRSRYRVIVPDHIGCGFSDKPLDYPYRLDQHISNISTLVDHLNLSRFTLMLHDWGGPIGFGLGRKNPGRVSQFVIFNTTAFFGPIPYFLHFARIPLISDFLIRGCNAFALIASHVGCYHREKMTKEIRAGYLFPYDNYANRIAVLRFIQDIPFGPTHPSYKTLKQIELDLTLFSNHPMLIVWGKHDPVFNDAYFKKWKSYFPQAELHYLEDAGHYVVEDASERIIPWVRSFLEKQENSSAVSIEKTL